MSIPQHVARMLLASAACSLLASSARAQLGLVTSTTGSGSIQDTQGHELAWEIGSALEEGTTLISDADSYAMLFFVGGIGAADIEFDGVIVVEVDQRTQLVIRSGAGRRSPIDVHVVRGGVRIFFDAREHGDYIQLSTPLGSMRITGSEIYATHDLPEQPGSVFGTFDSPCEVVLARGDGKREITSFEKVLIAGPDADLQVLPMVQGDSDHWQALPDLYLEAALAFRPQVSGDYATRAWVGEYVVSAQRIEDVAAESAGNIPTQEPIVSQTGARAILPALALAALARQGGTPPRLRSVREDRGIGEQRRVELGPKEFRVSRDPQGNRARRGSR